LIKWVTETKTNCATPERITDVSINQSQELFSEPDQYRDRQSFKQSITRSRSTLQRFFYLRVTNCRQKQRICFQQLMKKKQVCFLFCNQIFNSGKSHFKSILRSLLYSFFKQKKERNLHKKLVQAQTHFCITTTRRRNFRHHKRWPCCDYVWQSHDQLRHVRWGSD